jgi:hypothetical protein
LNTATSPIQVMDGFVNTDSFALLQYFPKESL